MIGIFDSGVGGLTVAKEIIRQKNGYQILYFGDTARLPYGTKGDKLVKKYSAKITKWLIENGADIIIVACNTSSAWASNHLKETFKDVPIFEMISPAVYGAKNATKNNRIGIIGTPGTIKSKAYQKALKKYKVFPVACPLFVLLAEEGKISGSVPEAIISDCLMPLKKKKIDTLILGCTHYPLLEKTIRKIMGPQISIINPAKILAQELKQFLKENPELEHKLKKGKNHDFYFSDEPYNLAKISKICLKKNIKAKILDPWNNE